MNKLSASTSVTHTNHCPAQCDIASEIDITRYGQVVQLKDLGNGFEALLELRDLGENQLERRKQRKVFSLTFLKWSPSLMTGVVSNILLGLMIS